MAASALVLAQSTDRSVIALVTALVAVIASVTRTNPLWLLLAGGILGFAGVA